MGHFSQFAAECSVTKGRQNVCGIVDVDTDLGKPEPPLQSLGQIESLLAEASLICMHLQPAEGQPGHDLMRDARKTLRLAADTVIVELEKQAADWRLLLAPDLDKFARMLCEPGSATARRVIKDALVYYRETVADPIERGHVAACIIELWE